MAGVFTKIHRHSYVNVSGGGFNKGMNAANVSASQDLIKKMDDNPLIKGMQHEIEYLEGRLKTECEKPLKKTVRAIKLVQETYIDVFDKYYCWNCKTETGNTVDPKYIGPVFSGECVLTHPQHQHQAFPNHGCTVVIFQRNLDAEEREVRVRD